MIKAIILAGGQGTRLGSLVKKVPKPMIKIGKAPLLLHQINLLKKYGIKEIAILTCYLPEVIKNYFRDGKKFGVKITYFNEENPLGTAGGIKEIEEKLDKNFLVLYGDVMVNMNLKRLMDFHKKKDAFSTLVLHPNNHPQDSDLVEINEDQRIIFFHPKPHPENEYFRNLVNAGLYVFSKKIVKYINKGEKADFGKDIFPKVVKKEKIFGYNTAEYLKDMGTPDRLAQVKKDCSSGKIERANRDKKRMAIFLDRDGVINKEVNLLHNIEELELFEDSALAIKKINNSEFLAVVVTNQPVVARNLCSIAELEMIHKKMETLLGNEGAKLDAIYYCPHHPDKGYPEENKKYKIKCNCRKPKIGMLKAAEKDFNIDFKKSYIIGDSERDILCGKNAGLKTIWVRNKKNYEERKVDSDYFFDNLLKAVEFIIKQKK